MFSQIQKHTKKSQSMAICACQLEASYKNTEVCESDSCQYRHTVLVHQITGNRKLYLWHRHSLLIV